jgi:hypothetical protein
VTRLREHRGYPCVSLLLAPGERGGQYDQSADTMLEAAERRLRLEMDAERVDSVLEPARELIERIEPPAAGLSLGVFVSSEMLEAVAIPIEVVPRVAIDDSFATRDLVTALIRLTPHYVLTVSRHRARLLEDDGRTLSEHLDSDWPVIAPPGGGSGSSPDQRDPARRRAAADQRLVRLVDTILFERLRSRPAPLVILTTPTMRSSIDRLRRRPMELLAEASHGGLDDLSAHDLRAIVQPLIDEDRRRRQQQALDEIDRSIGRKRCAAGIDEVWSCALEGRGELLVVEDNFAFPARITASGAHLAATDDVEHPDVFDDMVDDVIEQVLSTRGRVVVVPDGLLAERQRIALALRH